MQRTGILAVALMLLKVAGVGDVGAPLLTLGQSPELRQSSKPVVAPVLEITLYAPQQEEPPVHIVGFRNDKSEVQIVLSNESGKSVIGVKIDRVDIAPPGCRAVADGAPDEPIWFSTGGFPVPIAPHSQAVATGVGTPVKGALMPRTAPAHYPHSIFGIAQSSRAAHIQSQLGITAVWFEDGSTWPADWSSAGHPPGHQSAFDSSLVEAEAGKCTNVASVASALESVEEVVFGNQNSQPLDHGDSAAPPHLRFSCTLEGPKAICRLPLETSHPTSLARPEKVR